MSVPNYRDEYLDDRIVTLPERAPREIYCGGCNKTLYVEDGLVPEGWYILKKANADKTLRTVVLADSLPCLMRDNLNELEKRADRNANRY